MATGFTGKAQVEAWVNGKLPVPYCNLQQKLMMRHLPRPLKAPRLLRVCTCRRRSTALLLRRDRTEVVREVTCLRHSFAPSLFPFCDLRFTLALHGRFVPYSRTDFERSVVHGLSKSGTSSLPLALSLLSSLPFPFHLSPVPLVPGVAPRYWCPWDGIVAMWCEPQDRGY